MTRSLRIGIAGFGVVGKRRKLCVERQAAARVVAVCDREFDSDGTLADGTRCYRDYRGLLTEEMDILIVCLTNEIAAEVSIAGLE